MKRWWKVLVVPAVAVATTLALGASPLEGQTGSGAFDPVDRILVSTVEGGDQPFYVLRDSSAISPNGEWIAFTTGGRGIHGVPVVERVFVKNIATGQAWALDGEQVPRTFRLGSVDDDGTVVVSTGVSLDDDDQDAEEDLYRVTADGLATLVSGDTDGRLLRSAAGSAQGSVTAAFEQDESGAITLVVREAGDGVTIHSPSFEQCAVLECELEMSHNGEVVASTVTGEVPGNWLGSRRQVGVVDELAERFGPPPYSVVAPEPAGDSSLQLNWDASIAAWVPYPGNTGVVLLDRRVLATRHVDVEGSVRPIDLSADGQLLLAEVTQHDEEPSITLVDLATGESHVIADSNLAEAVALADFGHAVLWGDQAPQNSRLFVDRFSANCEVVGAYRNSSAELTLCSSGRVMGSLGTIPAGSPSWLAPNGAVDLLGTEDGWYVADAAGYVHEHGDAVGLSHMGGATLTEPIVAFIGDPTSFQTWQVAADGGVFAFGLTQYYGSAGDIALKEPIVTAMATPDFGGYWLVASDGGVFSFGNAEFHGSTGAILLDSPITAAVPTDTGGGYWLVAEDGGVFTFGDAAFGGSAAGSLGTGERVVDAGLLPQPGPSGYWLVTSTGRFIDFAA